MVDSLREKAPTADVWSDQRIPLHSAEELRRASLDTVDAIDKIAALTPMQRDLYLSYLMHSDATAFSVGMTINLGSKLDRQLWQRAVELVIEHDDTPRTIFCPHQGQVLQVVTRTNCHFEFIDAHLFPYSTLTREQIVQGKLRVRHDLFSTQPQWNNYLLLDSHNEYHAVVVTHHLLSDGPGLKIFLERVCAVYEVIAAHEKLDFSYFPSFYDCIAQMSESFDTEETTAYWQERLRHVVPLPAQKNAAPARKQARIVTIAQADLQRVKTYCTQQHCSLPAYFRFLYATLLSRYYAVQDDFVFYTLLNGRPPAYAHATGCFYHILPVVQEQGIREVAEALHATRQYRKHPGVYQYISTLLQRQLLKHEQVRFYYNFYNFGYIAFQGRKLDFVDYDYYDEQEVHLVVNEKPDKLELMLSYDSSVFSDEQFLERLLAISQQVVAGTERIADLDIVLPEEREQILQVSAPTCATYPYEAGFSELFERQVATTPDAIALADEHEQISYATLEQRAGSMAREFQARGIGVESLVAILAERGIAFTIAILALLKAGAAYLPLNPAHPPRQLALILAQNRVSQVVVSPELHATLEQALSDTVAAPPHMLYLDGLINAAQETTAIAPIDQESKAPGTATRLAYVISTSGSTGLPKGAMVEQRGMINHLYAKIAALQLGPGECVAQNAAQSFDISVWQLLAALLVGGRTQIIADHFNRDPLLLLEQIARYQVTVLETVPSLLQALFQLLQQKGLAHPALPMLRWLISTGEALPTRLADLWHTAYPDTPIINGYGPTECSDDVSHAVLRDAPEEDTLSVPIGRAIANTGLYVLDAILSPVPPGRPGELYVSGVGVGRGYRFDPAKTAAAFLPNPFATTPGERLYRTGDLVRRREDGSLEFLGRADFQVKIRGFRIELSEIETLLNQHGAVNQAIVLLQEDPEGEKRLIAYVVPQPGMQPTRQQLSMSLKEQLPAYMLPTAFVFLDDFPINHHGKIDRHALPPVERMATRQHDTAPTSLKALLTAIWSQVLEVDEIDDDDDFFSLGGNSLSALRILLRIQEECQRELTLRDLFTLPTIAELAHHLSEIPVSNNYSVSSTNYP